MLIPVISILLPLIGGALGFYIRYWMDKKKELTSEITKERREIYQLFVDLVIGIWDTSNPKKKKPDLGTELYRFYKRYVLYASPDVIVAFSNYFQFLYNQKDDQADPKTKESLLGLTRIMLAMRSDLGLKNKELGNDGEQLLRAMFRDYDSFMQEE